MKIYNKEFIKSEKQNACVIIMCSRLSPFMFFLFFRNVRNKMKKLTNGLVFSSCGNNYSTNDYSANEVLCISQGKLGKKLSVASRWTLHRIWWIIALSVSPWCFPLPYPSLSRLVFFRYRFAHDSVNTNSFVVNQCELFHNPPTSHTSARMLNAIKYLAFGSCICLTGLSVIYFDWIRK